MPGDRWDVLGASGAGAFCAGVCVQFGTGWGLMALGLVLLAVYVVRELATSRKR